MSRVLNLLHLASQNHGQKVNVELAVSSLSSLTLASVFCRRTYPITIIEVTKEIEAAELHCSFREIPTDIINTRSGNKNCVDGSKLN
jgi:hypothetical protein